jgi:hypothetical protein
MNEAMICKAITNGHEVTFSSVKVAGLNLENQITDDKKFGFLEPKDGVIKWRLINSDEEITERNARRAVAHAFFRWYLHVPIQFKRARGSEEADVTIEFRSEEEDSILNPSTLAYMYYPLGGSTNGICVVNKRFYWTNHGKGIDMHLIDPEHYPEMGSGFKGKTWDLDQVLAHEFGHGVFGLPHSQHEDRIMSAGYGMMDEFLHDEDIFRAQAKAGVRLISNRKLLRLTNWLLRRSEG